MKVKTFGIAAAIAAALAIGVLPAGAALNDGQLGGPPAGVADDTICPGGAAVTGVTGFTRLIGVTIPIVAVATVQCAGGGPASTMGSATGSAGELPGGTFCGPGQVAVGIVGREGDFIDNLFLRCRNADGSGPITPSVPSFGGPGLGGQPDGPYDCPAGQVLTGLTGQSVFTGTTIRYVEIVCSDLIPLFPTALTLSPAAGMNTVGTSHTVTATVTGAGGQPVPNVVVRFTVTGSVNTTGECTTDANGQCDFTYQGPPLPGADTIHAYADTNNSNTQDPLEPFGDATKAWVLPASTDFCEVKITQGGWIIAMNGDRASFGGNARVEGDDTVKGEQNYQDHGPAAPRHVKSIELTAMTCSDDRTEGTIFGRATVDGAGDFVFRIDVTDEGEPGRNDTYGITMSDGYVSGQQQLQGGNVQIHKN